MAKQDLHFSITASNDDLKLKLAESRQAILDSAKTAEAQASRVDGSFKRMALSAAAGFSAISFGKSIIRVREEMQMMEASFEVMLGSKAKANKMIAEIKQLAIDSPLEMPQVSSAVQTLLGFGVEAGKVIGIVGQLSDVAMGDADRFRSLTLAYAQTQSAGKLMEQGLLEMINAGFNPLSVIAEKTGKSIGQLQKEMTSGAISAEMVADAFDYTTENQIRNVGTLETALEKYKRQVEELKGARSLLANMQSDNSTASEIEVEAQKKKIKDLEQSLNIDSKVAPKTIPDTSKHNEARIKVEQKLQDQLVNIAFKTDQDIIDAKNEGYDKQLAQIELNYTKKFIAIERWERKQRKGIETAQKTTFVANGGKADEFIFNPTDQDAASALSAVSNSAAEQRVATLGLYTTSQVSLLNNLKQQWQSWGNEYQQIENNITKIKANAAKARQQINDQHTAGNINSDEKDIALLNVESGEKSQLEDLNSKKNTLTASWLSMFSDLKGMSRKEVDNLITAINEELQSKELTTANASALLDQLNKAKQYSMGLNPFAAWVDSLGDVKVATQQVETAKQKVLQLNLSGSETEKTEAEKALQEAQKVLASSKERRAVSTKKSLGDISSVAGATSTLLKTFGVESPAIDGVMGALGSLSSIDFTNPISIVTGGLQAISSLLVGIFGESDKTKEQQIKRFQEQIDKLEKSYEKLSDAVDKAYSSEASGLIDDQNVMLEQQKQLIQNQILAEQSKKNGDDGRIEEWKKSIEEIDKTIENNKEKAIDVIFGADLQSAINDFASSYMNAWASGEDRAQSQKDVVQKMIRGIIQEMIKSDIKGTVEKMRKQINGFMGDGVLSDWELDEINKTGAEVGQIMEQRGKMYDKVLRDDKPEEKNESSLTGQIQRTMTEQTAAEFGGIWRGQHEKLSSIDRKMDLGITNLLDIARTNLLIEQNTRRTADNTDGLRDVVNEVGKAISATNERLGQVIKNTKTDNGTL